MLTTITVYCCKFRFWTLFIESQLKPRLWTYLKISIEWQLYPQNKPTEIFQIYSSQLFSRLWLTFTTLLVQQQKKYFVFSPNYIYLTFVFLPLRFVHWKSLGISRNMTHISWSVINVVTNLHTNISYEMTQSSPVRIM